VNTAQPVGVLVVDDDPIIAAGHAEYVRQVPGFTVAGVAHSGTAALAALEHAPVDLVLLDIWMPDMSGLDLCRTLRGQGRTVDVIAITSARDLAMVRALVALGIAQYLLKPFTMATFRKRLEQYAEYRRRVWRPGSATDQSDVDHAIAALRGDGSRALPKGLSQETLGSVVSLLGRRMEGASAADVGIALGVSRVTGRRYLEHLTEEGVAERTSRYGRTGRPEHLYHLTAVAGGGHQPSRPGDRGGDG
jgi:response regulator of citrate/malate metabolism